MHSIVSSPPCSPRLTDLCEWQFVPFHSRGQPRQLRLVPCDIPPRWSLVVRSLLTTVMSLLFVSMDKTSLRMSHRVVAIPWDDSQSQSDYEVKTKVNKYIVQGDSQLV